MLDIFLTSQFKKDYKKIRKTKNVDNLLNVVNLIRNGERLPAQYRDHNLSGAYKATAMRVYENQNTPSYTC